MQTCRSELNATPLRRSRLLKHLKRILLEHASKVVDAQAQEDRIPRNPEPWDSTVVSAVRSPEAQGEKRLRLGILAPRADVLIARGHLECLQGFLGKRLRVDRSFGDCAFRDLS